VVAGHGNRAEHTVLVVADDRRVLGLAQAVLAREHRVLLACDSKDAVRLLKQSQTIPIHSVAIRAGISGQEEVRTWSLRQGAAPWTFRAEITDHSVTLEGPDSGDDWESSAWVGRE